jgi:hypothetical protein
MFANSLVAYRLAMSALLSTPILAVKFAKRLCARRGGPDRRSVAGTRLDVDDDLNKSWLIDGSRRHCQEASRAADRSTCVD